MSSLSTQPPEVMWHQIVPPTSFYHIQLILGKCRSNIIASWNDLVQILNIHSGNTGKLSRASVFEIVSEKLNMKTPVDMKFWLCHLTCIFRIGVRSAIIIMLWSTNEKGKCINSYDSWIMHKIYLHQITCRNSHNYFPDDILQLQLLLHTVTSFRTNPYAPNYRKPVEYQGKPICK